jgi:hypothetical protein
MTPDDELHRALQVRFDELRRRLVGADEIERRAIIDEAKQLTQEMLALLRDIGDLEGQWPMPPPPETGKTEHER